MKSEIRDGLQIDWDAPIAMDDGVVLRADVFRPVADGKYPVILSYGPYAKGLAMQEGYKSAWLRITKSAPEVLEGSSNKYQNWELFDPEKWVPDGYVLVRVDSRGAGRSPGYLEVWSPREAQDIAQSVDWAGTQPWSNGKVGLHGISYYSMNQWQAAPLKPKHLAALCIWEGSSDYYRELCRHGGILSDFYSSWYPRQVTAVQHGVGERGFKSAVTGEPVAGPPTLSEEELERNRADCDGDALRHRLIDDYYRARLPKFEDIETPLLSAANWGGMGLHPRGNFEGFLRAGSEAEVAGGARRHPLHAVLRQVRPGPAEALLRSLPQGRGQRLGAAAEGAAQHPPSRRKVRAARRERMAARAHAMDQVLSASRPSLGTEPAAAAETAEL